MNRLRTNLKASDAYGAFPYRSLTLQMPFTALFAWTDIRGRKSCSLRISPDQYNNVSDRDRNRPDTASR
jgi:hypothetical protein